MPRTVNREGSLFLVGVTCGLHTPKRSLGGAGLLFFFSLLPSERSTNYDYYRITRRIINAPGQQVRPVPSASSLRGFTTAAPLLHKTVQDSRDTRGKSCRSGYVSASLPTHHYITDANTSTYLRLFYLVPLIDEFRTIRLQWKKRIVGKNLNTSSMLIQMVWKLIAKLTYLSGKINSNSRLGIKKKKKMESFGVWPLGVRTAMSAACVRYDTLCLIHIWRWVLKRTLIITREWLNRLRGEIGLDDSKNRIFLCHKLLVKLSKNMFSKFQWKISICSGVTIVFKWMSSLTCRTARYVFFSKRFFWDFRTL